MFRLRLLKFLFPDVYEKIMQTGFSSTILDPKTKIIQIVQTTYNYPGDQKAGEEIDYNLKLTKTWSNNITLSSAIEFSAPYDALKKEDQFKIKDE